LGRSASDPLLTHSGQRNDTLRICLLAPPTKVASRIHGVVTLIVKTEMINARSSSSGEGTMIGLVLPRCGGEDDES
jgi:hypothetical protein